MRFKLTITYPNKTSGVEYMDIFQLQHYLATLGGNAHVLMMVSEVVSIERIA